MLIIWNIEFNVNILHFKHWIKFLVYSHSFHMASGIQCVKIISKWVVKKAKMFSFPFNYFCIIDPITGTAWPQRLRKKRRLGSFNFNNKRKTNIFQEQIYLHIQMQKVRICNHQIKPAIILLETRSLVSWISMKDSLKDFYNIILTHSNICIHINLKTQHIPV